jgi:hypothetical protein
MPNSYSEVDAMRDVDGALNKLGSDIDAQRRIIQWIMSKYGSNAQPIESNQTHSSAPQPSVKRPADIKNFMIQKRPLNNYERVACLTYYLEKFKDMPDVGAKDIVDANTEARLQRMSNPAVFIKHATHTYGYLNSISKGRLVLSSKGEAVVEALPDRDEVGKALTNFTLGKTRTKKGKKTATQ